MCVCAHTSIIEQLKITLKNQEAEIHQKRSADQQTDGPSADGVKQLSDLIAKKDQELDVSFLYFPNSCFECTYSTSTTSSVLGAYKKTPE